MIRPARDGDAARLAEIHVAAWRRGCRDILPAELLAGVSIDRRTRDWSQWLTSPGSLTQSSSECRVGPSQCFPKSFVLIVLKPE